ALLRKEQSRMAKEGSVAPKERVNIIYKSATPEGMEEVELPLKILMMGDYMGRQDNRPLEERKPINIDKSNFSKVMAEQNLSVDITVADKLSGEKEALLGDDAARQKLTTELGLPDKTENK